MHVNNNYLNNGEKAAQDTDNNVALSDAASKYGLIFRKLGKQNIESANEIDNDSQDLQNDVENEPSAADKFRQAAIKARFIRKLEKLVDDRMTVRQIFNRYVENSTLHGLRFIFMQTFVVRRVLWTLLTVTMAVIFLTELKNSIELYLAYPFTTTSTMEYIHSLTFPAISICNLNSFQEPHVHSNRAWHLYKRALLPTHYHNTTMHDIPGNKLRRILQESAPSFSDIFQSCEWRSQDTAKSGFPNLCSGDNFTSYVDLHGQTCFTFNGGNSINPLILNKAGLNMALKLEFDLKAINTAPLQEIGLKIIIHDQGETPLQQAGFVVAPGFQSLVELKVRTTKNLPGPYATRCGEHPLSFYEKYRQSKCFLENLTKEILEECKCTSLYMDALALDGYYPPCSLKQTVTCLLPLVDKFDRKTNRDCPVDCETITYGTSLSYARFISKVVSHSLFKGAVPNYIQKLQREMNGSKLQKYIEENVLVVQFFYQEMKEEKVGQEKSYDHFKLIGDVGGQLGLLLGASVLTLVEFVDLFFFTLYHQLLRLYRRKKRGGTVAS